MKQSPKISTEHLNRMAVVYARSATRNTESVRRQRTQVEYARQWGWPETRIVVIKDIGKSGANPDREGFRRMRGMIESGQVGLVLVEDVSRLSRSASDFHMLLPLCQRTETLLAVDGTIYDYDDTSRFMSVIRNVVSEYESKCERWALVRQLFGCAGPQPDSDPEAEMGRLVAMDPDRFAREVAARLVAGFERFEKIDEVTKNAARLAENLPPPAAKLVDYLLEALNAFKGAGQDWLKGRETGSVN